MSVTPELDFFALQDRLQQLPLGSRTMVAVAGPPAAGKSTTAEKLAEALNTARPGVAAVMAMDGFHYDDIVLREIGLLHRKGAPNTFDIGGLKASLERLKRDDGETVAVPVFDRSIEIARAGARLVPPSVRIIVVEGNYLLLARPEWAVLRPLFDLAITIKTDPETLRERLMRRWLDLGLSADVARSKVDGNDMQNAKLVVEESQASDLILV